MGEITNITQMKEINCRGGGQFMTANAEKNVAMIVDYNNLIGLNTQNLVVIRKLDLETGKCKELLNYQGSFDLFDLSSSGTSLAYGGEGQDDSVVIWDMEKLIEICRTSKVKFGRFVPGENTLAVIREQKLVFIDASTCHEIKELNIVPSFDYENYLAFSPDGKQFAVAKDSIQIVNVATGEILAKIPFPENAVPISSKFFLNGIKFSPNGRYLLIAYFLLNNANNGKIQLWQLRP
jgi:WD40 repeat protein